MELKWITPKNLGTVADGSYFEKRLIANSPGYNVNYRIISGHIPVGINLTPSGNLVGVPSIMNDVVGELNRQIKFTVRAENNLGRLSDRTFNLLISGVQAPSILTTTTNLGVYYDGDFFSYQLEARDDHPGSRLTWKYIRGRMPPGITLDRNGLLQGFFYQNKVSDEAFRRIGWDKLSWDRFMYDFIQQQHDTDYEFTVELNDGINYSRQNYIIRVIARDLLTADRTIRSADDTLITVDRTPIHRPFITTMPQRLPEIKPELTRQNTYFAFKFDAIDFDGDEIYYEITSPDELGFDQNGDVINHEYGTGFDMDAFDSSEYPMPTYLGLDNHTGWYTGQIGRQVESRRDYLFQIYARKPYNRILGGYRSNFIVTVLGQVDENVTWVTDQNLGFVTNGDIALLKVQAVNSSGNTLEYRIKGNGSRLPQGLRLQKTGMISGRVSFDYFTLDQGDTTVDFNKTTSFDKVFTFTVIAETLNKSAFSEKTFTITVNHTNTKPYENLYLKGFPNIDQRRLFKSIMDREDLFPSQLIYRLDDPYYGKAKDLRFLFMSGINPATLSMYIESLSRNHYTKTVLFGDVKTAVALDSNFNIQYEVVYLDVIDNLEGKDPITGNPSPPAQTIDLSKNQNFYTMPNGSLLTEFTPNALGNMKNRIEETIGLANPSSLPQWMTSPQPDYENPGKFTSPIGYVRAVVLAYTIPGAAKLIAYRLKNANFSFNNIPFKTDRYQLDNYLTKNYDLNLGEFLPGVETTIDYLPSKAELYRDLGTVNYAVSGSYSSINGKTVADINALGGIDGDTNFKDGDTVIFVQPETFGPEKPGYFEKIMFGNLDEKSFVYQININQEWNIVTLSVFRQTRPGDIVTVTKGITYKNKKLNFEAYPLHGISPRWWPFNKNLTLDPNSMDNLVEARQETTFDQRGTRFISYRDQYADIDSTAKYIKFPNNGVFS
jgi:hypothetical protein